MEERYRIIDERAREMMMKVKTKKKTAVNLSFSFDPLLMMSAITSWWLRLILFFYSFFLNSFSLFALFLFPFSFLFPFFYAKRPIGRP